MIPVIPAVVLGLGVAAYWRRRKNRGVMTPERLKIFNAAISGAVKDPKNLDKLANSFAGEGLYAQATLLRQRAKLKRLPESIKQARKDIWRRAIQSKNKAGILKLAAAYDKEGCTGAAMRLREIASGLPDQVPEPVAIESVEAESVEVEPREESDDPGESAEEEAAPS
jgi:hypothetical protein